MSEITTWVSFESQASKRVDVVLFDTFSTVLLLAKSAVRFQDPQMMPQQLPSGKRRLPRRSRQSPQPSLLIKVLFPPQCSSYPCHWFHGSVSTDWSEPLAFWLRNNAQPSHSTWSCRPPHSSASQLSKVQSIHHPHLVFFFIHITRSPTW